MRTDFSFNRIQPLSDRVIVPFCDDRRAFIHDLRHLHELMWPTKAATAAAISVTLKVLPWVIKLLIETAGDRRSHSLKSNHHSQSTQH